MLRLPPQTASETRDWWYDSPGTSFVGFGGEGSLWVVVGKRRSFARRSKELLGRMTWGSWRKHPGSVMPWSGCRAWNGSGNGISSGGSTILIGSLEGGPDDPVSFGERHFLPLAVGPDKLEEAATILADTSQDGLHNVPLFCSSLSGPIHFNVEVDQPLQIVVTGMRTCGFF